MKFLSLFAGIGGLDLGLERAGMECVGQVEISHKARRVLRKHWPNVKRWTDVRKFKGTDLHEKPDLICGGFPCQDISFAGKGAGIVEGKTRSGLWFEYRRIIREIRPRYVLVENVPALLVRGLGTVLGGLASLGYDAEWDCIPAAAVGAHHLRDRIWIVAHAKNELAGNQANAFGLEKDAETRPPPAGPAGGLSIMGGRGGTSSLFTNQRIITNAEIITAGSEQSGNGGKTTSTKRTNQTPPPRGSPRLCGATNWNPEPGICRVVDGFSAGVDRLEQLGNAVVPQVAEWIGRRIMQHAVGVHR